MIPVEPVPPGSESATGMILRVSGPLEGWLTQDGAVTGYWGRRGIWDTPEEAQEALERFVKEGKVSE